MQDNKKGKIIGFLLRTTSLVLIISMLVLCCSCSDSDFDGKRFGRTRHITVFVEDVEDSDPATTVANSAAARYIHDSVLQDCNIDVEFVEFEEFQMPNGRAADISFTVHYDMLNTYYRMNAITNLAPYLDEYSDSLTNLKTLLGDENIYACTDDPSEVWYLTARDYSPSSKVTFIRADWLKTLGLEVPSTREELHDCLIAFRDNADLLMGDDASSMVPFFIDGDPSSSAKPLFDSCLDTSIDDRAYYINGWSRTTQNGYSDGLKILNDWYIESLLPQDFMSIEPLSKESYEPIENGYVGAFCASYDYLYANGSNSHFKAFRSNCGEEATYIAVNTFENSEGRYTSWWEEALGNTKTKIYIPKTCSDPLACLVYLNWLSDPANISVLQNIADSVTDDPFSSDRYLLTFNGAYPDASNTEPYEISQARNTAMAVEEIYRGNKCVRYGFDAIQYEVGSNEYDDLYPGSVRLFTCSTITAGEGEFDSVYNSAFEEYLNSGAFLICKIRSDEWDKVMVRGDLSPW